MPQFCECTGKKPAPNNAIQMEDTLYHAVGDRGEEMESSKIQNQSILHCQVETAHAPVWLIRERRAKASKTKEKCCRGNTYRFSLVSQECKDCPTDSTSRLGGYYCQKEEEEEKPGTNTAQNSTCKPRKRLTA